LTLVLGLVAGARGFMAYAYRAAEAANDATFELAARQIRGQIPQDVAITTFATQSVSALSLPAFALFTPLGLFATYLVASSVIRAVSTFVDQPIGDPVLTGLDALLVRWRARLIEHRLTRAREREEGPDVPDRLFAGPSAGLPEVDYVVVSVRRKADWTAGTFVVAAGTWFKVGEPFEARLAQGLRTVYPLTEARTGEARRRIVTYDLPPVQPGALRLRAPSPSLPGDNRRDTRPPPTR
jgi:hypothetical protein